MFGATFENAFKGKQDILEEKIDTTYGLLSKLEARGVITKAHRNHIEVNSILFITECLRLRIGVAISRMLRLREACYWLSAWQQAGAVHHGTRTAAIVNVRRFVTKPSLFTCKWVG